MSDSALPHSPAPPKKSSNRLLWWLVALAVFSIILSLVLPLLESPPRFAASENTTVEIRLPGQPDPVVVSSDPAAIGSLVEALNGSRRAFQFRDDPVATITLKQADQDVVVDILPGDHETIYLYVQCKEPGGIWRVSREPLARAMSGLGLAEFPERP